ncbi:MAG: hypothetical protein ACP5D7_04010 [Limnospira sp.]
MSNPIQNPTVSNGTPPGGSSPYSPSVPISLYREVTAELQASQTLIDSLKTQNQQLIEQNQNLRQELDHVIRAASQLQQAVEVARGKSQMGLPQMPPSVVPGARPSFQVYPVEGETPPSAPSFSVSPEPQGSDRDLVFPPPPEQPQGSGQPDLQFSEEPEGRLRPASQPERSELSGVWLVVSIALIVIAAFGAGYWVVRPLLQQR